MNHKVTFLTDSPRSTSHPMTKLLSITRLKTTKIWPMTSGGPTTYASRLTSNRQRTTNSFRTKTSDSTRNQYHSTYKATEPSTRTIMEHNENNRSTRRQGRMHLEYWPIL